MAKQKPWFTVRRCSSFLLLLSLSKSASAENKTTEVFKNTTNPDIKTNSTSELLPTLSSAMVPPSPISTTVLTTSTSAPPIPTTPVSRNIVSPAAFIAAATHKSEAGLPYTLPDFIIKMMSRFGEAKAAEAFQSLDQLPLGLVMKILLVEMDKNLAADIVAMQRYAQTSDKALITMIGRIVAGDKNVPKELIAMDVKLMKFPWWMRIRERMLSNLEKYIQAYSLVPVAIKTTAGGANIGVSKSVRELETEDEGLRSDLTAAVAASATESSNKILNQVAAAVAPSTAATSASGSEKLESLRLSLLNPLQQQQLLGTLALAQAASNLQTQQLLQLQQTKQATNTNPFLFV